MLDAFFLRAQLVVWRRRKNLASNLQQCKTPSAELPDVPGRSQHLCIKAQQLHAGCQLPIARSKVAAQMVLARACKLACPPSIPAAPAASAASPSPLPSAKGCGKSRRSRVHLLWRGLSWIDSSPPWGSEPPHPGLRSAPAWTWRRYPLSCWRMRAMQTLHGRTGLQVGCVNAMAKCGGVWFHSWGAAMAKTRNWACRWP